MAEYDAASVILGRSQIRRRILAMLLDAPGRRMHLRAIAREADTSAGTAARELGRLEDAGLIRRGREGIQVYFEARPNQPAIEAIREIVRQYEGASRILRQRLLGLKGVERALIFGSYASGKVDANSDVDVLIVGAPDRDDLSERLELASLEISRPVNEVVISADELAARRARGDRLIESIDSHPVIDVGPPA
jgi:predicted nucleotidyltransferase